MPSRSPEVRLEVLESRFAPARLVAGPPPAQYGADLADAALENANELQPFAGETGMDWSVAFGDEGLSDYTLGTVGAENQIVGGVIKSGAGTLTLNSGGTLASLNLGVLFDPSFAAGSLTLFRPVEVPAIPAIPPMYTASAGSFDSGAVLDLNAAATFTYSGSLQFYGGTLVAKIPSYSSISYSGATMLVASGSSTFSGSFARILSIVPVWNGSTLLKTPAEFVNVDGPVVPDDLAIAAAPIPVSLGSA